MRFTGCMTFQNLNELLQNQKYTVKKLETVIR